MTTDKRTAEQIKEHYETEKELASRLRSASKEQRKKLYSEVYDTFFKSISHLPQLSESAADRQKKIDYDFREVQPFLRPETIYLEVGAGDCKVALAVAEKVKKVIVIEASDERLKKIATPDNFEVIVGDSTEINLPDNSFDVVFSNQVMEHLHPDDAREQLNHIYRILKQGGKYLCMTPNFVTGPHDISKHFDTMPMGFHLKEYTITELYMLFKDAGFSKVKVFSRYKSIRVFMPFIFYYLKEKMFLSFSHKIRSKITQNALMLKFFGVNIIGIK